MNLRNFSALLALVTCTLLAANANAATCTLRSSSGSCLLYSNGAGAIVNTDNPQVNAGGGGMTQFFTSIVPTSDGIVTCGNPGSKSTASPGIQLVYLPNFTDFFTPITFTNAITKNDIKNGQATIDTGGAFFGRVANTNPCPNTGWAVLDAVACNANLVVRLQNVSDSTTIEAVQESCSLDDSATVTTNECLSLPFSSKTGLFQKTFYACGAAVPVQ